MSYICGSCHRQHESVIEAKQCYGLVPRPVPVRPAEAMVTEPQLNYVDTLGGDRVHAARLTRREASHYIDQLKRGIGVNLPTSAPRVQQPASDPRVDMLNNLLPSLPDGRYAVRSSDEQPFVFLRVKRHTRGRLNGCLTIQTQHSERLMRAAVRWTSGFWSWERRDVIDLMLIACVDPKQAAYNYAKALNRCGVCGKELTDERSRWYGIGPDCETRHPAVIEWVDDNLHDGKPYEIARQYTTI